ncbi:response regulator transcription factor [Devosia sp. PTR5]|uniref:Response regulator transcription factor n=1 Tax=Devosia oryzisoli TaxID=2774138 RepID=A0A927IUK9_9HYPH|nr:response regulator transcription factor [Devosia oryzisoli]MBD8066811.1 response regulator transcription factor [Devosia oryzisoli]
MKSDGDQDDSMSTEGNGRPKIIFKVREDLVTRALVRAIADCHLDYEVRLVQRLPEGEEGVHLVACQVNRDSDIRTCVQKARDVFPEAIVVLLVEGQCLNFAIVEDLVGAGVLQGVMPVHLPLSVWLAAFGLLLNGGVYLPPDYFLHRKAAASPPIAVAEPAGPPQRSGMGGDLTRREQEVLGFLSMGFQNKIIASRMNLSEYTVKIHVHNIIHKLKVHNRTQAAAMWLGKSSPQPGHLEH